MNALSPQTPTLFSHLAEQGLLGAILQDNRGFELAEELKPPDFVEPFHQKLFALMEDGSRHDQLVDITLAASRFEGDSSYHALGGSSYLMDLVDRAPPTTSVRHYAKAIADFAIRRDLVALIDQAKAETSDQSKEGREWLSDLEQRLFTLAEGRGASSGFEDFSAPLARVMTNLAAAYAGGGGLSGISTGLIDLDRRLGGLHASDLIILAGRPGMGKTALATNIAFNVAKAGFIVGFDSLEMSAEQLSARLLAEVSGVSSERARRGSISEAEFSRIRDAERDIREVPLKIDATGGLALSKLCARARRLKRKSGLHLLIVDYLQLVTGSETARRGGRVQEVSEITQGLKALAKELDVPILALSQLSRQVEGREDKRPLLSDLRESGSIEQDADVVLFVYREAYYLQNAEPKAGSPEHMEWEQQLEELGNVAEVIVGKQRHGSIGTVRLHFDGSLTKFSNLACEPRYRDPYGSDQ